VGRPAVAVDPATAERLEGLTVTLHVPLLYEAALQCDRLADLPEAAKPRRRLAEPRAAALVAVGGGPASGAGR
jgi:hypothetical protein